MVRKTKLKGRGLSSIRRQAFLAALALAGAFTAACIGGTNGEDGGGDDGGEVCNDTCGGPSQPNLGEWICQVPLDDDYEDCLDTIVDVDLWIEQCEDFDNGEAMFIPPCDGGGGSAIDPTGLVYLDSASGDYIVDDGLLDDVLDGTESLEYESLTFTLRSDGYYDIAGVTTGSLAEAMGLQNGDILQTLNGVQLKAAYYAGAYDAIVNDTTWNVRIKRGSTVVAHTYKVQ